MPEQESKEVSGTPILVKVAAMGELVKEVALSSEATIQEALEAANFETEDAEDIRMNGNEVNLEDTVEDNAVITLVPQVDGGY